MSTRAIAPIVGAGVMTVQDDLSRVRNRTPDPLVNPLTGERTARGTYNPARTARTESFNQQKTEGEATVPVNFPYGYLHPTCIPDEAFNLSEGVR